LEVGQHDEQVGRVALLLVPVCADPIAILVEGLGVRDESVHSASTMAKVAA
jgi:hypothetical protein